MTIGRIVKVGFALGFAILNSFDIISSYVSVASRKNQLSDEFFKIGFMPYFLSLNSPLSRYRDGNSKSALAFFNQHMEKR